MSCINFEELEKRMVSPFAKLGLKILELGTK